MMLSVAVYVNQLIAPHLDKFETLCPEISSLRGTGSDEFQAAASYAKQVKNFAEKGGSVPEYTLTQLRNSLQKPPRGSNGTKLNGKPFVRMEMYPNNLTLFIDFYKME